MKRTYYFFKNYKYDFIPTFFLISSAIVGYYIRSSLFLSIAVIIISLIIIIFLRLRDKSFYFIPLTSRKDKDEWIGKGEFEYSRVKKCFQITSSDSGYIFSKCFMWSDYRYKFEFKIIKSYLGIIVRAINLSNYAMLQIGKDGIRPHIKVNGAWRVWEYKDVNLDFENTLKLDNWYECITSCEKDVINIKIFGDEGPIFDRDWIIPSGQINFIFKKDEEDKKPLLIPFAINLEYGTIGFRNSGNEKALLRNVLVERI